MTPEFMIDQVVIYGSPDDVTRQISEMRQEVGPFGVLVSHYNGAADTAKDQESLRLLGETVRPQVDNLVAA